MPTPVGPAPASATSGRASTDPALDARILSNGDYQVLISPAGTGVSRAGDHALTVFAADAIGDRDGFFFYLKDLESGALWSAAPRPTPEGEGPSAANWTPGKYTITRACHGIESELDICVAPDANLEIRRLTLRNRSGRRRRIEVASYAEVVLDRARSFASHPGFSKLFLQTEFVVEARTLLVRRRPRAEGDLHPWLFHSLIERDPSFETSRECFLGRDSKPERPAALDGPAPAGTVGNVLDPVVSLRDIVTIDPGASATATFLLGVGADRREALKLQSRFAGPGAVDAAFDAAAESERRLLLGIGLSDAEAEYFQSLAGAMLYGHSEVRAAVRDADRPLGIPKDLLERYGIRSDAALAVLHAEGRNDATPAREFLRGAAYWRARGLSIEAVVVGDVEALAPLDGSTHLLSRRDIADEDLELLDAVARCVVRGSLPELSGNEEPESRAARAAAPSAAPVATKATTPRPALELFNGFGGFDENGTEYVIPLVCGPDRHMRRPPRPWINVIANPRLGFLVSETGAGYTWAGNSREHRLTPWFNDPLLDPHGEALYIRDEATGAFWSPLPGPAPRAGEYEMRHGFGYSRCRFTVDDLEQETLLFVPRSDPVKITRLRVTNHGKRTRRLSFVSYAQLVLGVFPEDGATILVSEDGSAANTLFAKNRLAGDFARGVAFASVVAEAADSVHCTADRASFVGQGGSLESPAALRRGDLDGRVDGVSSRCFAQQVVMTVPAGGTIEVVFLLGEGQDAGDARSLVERYREPGRVESALGDVREFWREGLGGIRIETPSRPLDLLVNGWLPYQTLACRIWGRSALYQSGGAFGFRDQLQDASALVGLWPDLTREQILRHAAHQFVEGDVLHWWHPPASLGIRTRFADDLLWLPALTAHYVGTTGDDAILTEEIRFLRAPALEPGEDEVFLRPQAMGDSADLYEHCCRALDRSLTNGAHGLPLFGTGDWNDGMNRVGRGGQGESVWMGFFLFWILGEFAPFCERRGDAARSRRYATHRAQLREAIEANAWDGAWYRRGYYDDGTPLGSSTSDECRIDALVQAWSVLSGAAPPERAAQAMASAERDLVSEKDRLIRLLTPPFENTRHDPGYIKGYVRGVRENGGQYTHAALWVIAAMARLGKNDRVAKLLDMLNPVTHAATVERCEIYQLEPYVVAADIYGEAPHVGRGGWSWYTGSAGWMMRVAMESLLGVRMIGGREIAIAPCVPDEWPGFVVTLRLPGEETSYEIRASNPKRRARRVVSANVDGVAIEVDAQGVRVPLVHDGAAHRVDVTLGAEATRT